MHIITEVKAEVIRFSPYRLALVGPHKITECLICGCLCVRNFYYGHKRLRCSIRKGRNRTISARDNKKNQTQINDEIRADVVRLIDAPVCKILDYGKYRYEQQKKEKNAKKNQHVTEIKEIRLSASIEDHDVEVKAKAATKFLQDGDKVKVSLRFRGRERDYTQLGFDAMKKFADMVADYGVIEKEPKMEGRRMNMFLAPKKDKK